MQADNRGRKAMDWDTMNCKNESIRREVAFCYIGKLLNDPEWNTCKVYRLYKRIERLQNGMQACS